MERGKRAYDKNEMINSEQPNLEHIIRRMQSDDSVDAPADAVKYVRNLFLTRLAEPKTSLLQKVLAVLHMDIAPGRAAFGERSAVATHVRQMLFGAGDNSVDLRIEKSGKNFTVKGQILGEGFALVEVKMTSKENSFATPTNDMSEFRFTNIAAGTYVLTLTGSDNEIVLENLEIN